MSYGDVDAAFKNAPHVFEEEMYQHRGGAMTLEGRAVLASQDAASGLLTVWSSTQTPHLCRGTLADLLERDLESIRVIAPFVGGGFGTKAPFYPEEAVIPAAAIKLGRPVKWQEDRREHFLSATQERDQYWKVAIAVDGEGKILGLRGTMLHDTGAYLPWGIIVPFIAATTFPGPYVVPAYKIETTVALTNRVPTTVVRGAGRPQAVFAMERLMDRVARELKLDRERGARAQHDPGRADALRAGADVPRRQAAGLCQRRLSAQPAPRRGAVRATTVSARGRPRQRAKGRYLGIGIGNYVEGTGLGPFEGVTVRVLPNGKVAVATGATTQGQGTRTTLSQIVADHLGCRIEDIVMTGGDTGAISQGIGAFASRQAINAGSSAMIAGDAVKQQVLAAASRALGVPESDIDVEDGKATARTGNKPSLTFGELARMAQGMPGFSFAPGQTPGLEHTAYFTPPQASYCNGTHVVEVEVDPMTGGVTLLRYTVAHDSGNVINPMIVDGQVQGGVAHGIGNALFEWMSYDDGGTAAHHHVPGLSAAGGARRAGLRHRACRDAEPAQPARRQGRGRRRHHPGAGRDRRAPSRTRFRRSACASPTCRSRPSASLRRCARPALMRRCPRHERHRTDPGQQIAVLAVLGEVLCGAGRGAGLHRVAGPGQGRRQHSLLPALERHRAPRAERCRGRRGGARDRRLARHGGGADPQCAARAEIAAAGRGRRMPPRASAPASRRWSWRPSGCSRRRSTRWRNRAGSASQPPPRSRRRGSASAPIRA